MSSKIHYAKVSTCFLSGLQPVRTELEITIIPGLPSVEIVGLVDSSVRESKNRVKSAIKNTGFLFPNGRITVSLIPAYIHKSGTCVDLPLALGILLASGQIRNQKESLFAYGELALNGRVKEVPGGILRLLDAKEFSCIIAPDSHAVEIKLSCVRAYAAGTLRDAVAFLEQTKKDMGTFHRDEALLDYEWGVSKESREPMVDFSFLRGQEKTRRAILIAAAGFHSILFSGQPGCGKTTAARILHGLLPPMSKREQLEVMAVRSLSAVLRAEDMGNRIRPFRYVTSSCKCAGLKGGGNPFFPGELILSRHGVLFFDELPEFSSHVLECIRQMMDEKHISEAPLYENQSRSFSPDFLFAASMNPCRCGNLLESNRSCICSETQKSRYVNRISGAVYDRIDMVIEMTRTQKTAIREIHNKRDSETQKLRLRIKECWEIQYQRSKRAGLSPVRNGELEDGLLYREVFHIPEKVMDYATEVSDRLRLSVRSHLFLLRVARTVGDLESAADMTKDHILEAVCFRKKR